jgi:inosine/xanthosine triphosphate pyrophosphatase family protein
VAVMIFAEEGERRETVVEAAFEGVIADRCYPRIQPGFPYRAVLMIPQRGCYLAELGEEEAAILSQRRSMVDQLANDLRRIAAA